MSTSSNPLIIGLAGTFVGGKDTYAEHLKATYGYKHVSTGDMVREIAMEERGSIERPILFETANKWRQEHGAGVFVKLALQGKRPIAVTGLRSLGEAKSIHEHGGILVFIDAPLEVRYKRMIGRARDAEVQITLEEFQAREQKEWHAGDGDADFNLRGIKAMSDIVVDNEYSLEEFLGVLDGELGLK